MNKLKTNQQKLLMRIKNLIVILNNSVYSISI